MTVSIRLKAKEQTPTLPPAFGAAHRGTGMEAAATFLPDGFLVPTGTFELAGGLRDVPDATTAAHAVKDDELVILELEDGSQFVTSARRLQETLLRLHPDWVVDGVIPLERLSELGGTGSQRDIATIVGGLVKTVFTVVAGGGGKDAIADAVAEELKKRGLGAAERGVTWLGTQALMWAIESQLKPGPGFYSWNASGGAAGELQPPDSDRLARAAAENQPLLVFVHGTGSSTMGSFRDLATGDGALWSDLRMRYPGGLYALEHRTFSESPIDNALALAEALPTGARVSFVSHSRGGLVVDLLCAASLEGEIDRYTRAPNLPGLGTMDPDSDESKRIVAELDTAHAIHRAQLRRLAVVLRDKRFVVERYVRVASPAAGTKLASGNLDLFLSGLLNLAGLVPALAVSPSYAALKRIVIEIVRNRTDAHLVPGIEAMLPDSPMAAFLPRLPVREGLRMALIAGDIEGGSLLKRLGVFLTDTLLFEADDNDLIVNTTAMLAGLAPRATARVMFDRGASVSHFNYFENVGTRRALRDWLVSDAPEGLASFRALPRPEDFKAALAAAARDIGGAQPDVLRPVAVVLPGVMGSHLRKGAQGRVWFDLSDIALGGLSKIAWDSQDVEAEGLFEMFYGEFCNALGKTHRVERFAYDWRQPMDVLADRLGEYLERLQTETPQPIRLVAHSMGGLVLRACIHKRRGVMDAVMAREGSRLVMLGTPNQGAHSMVANLIGKGDSLRQLVCLDTRHSMQQVLDIVGDFRGALQLLPKGGFVDMFEGQPGGGERHDYRDPATWTAFKPLAQDFWFGNGTVATPSQAVLDEASWLWDRDGTGTPALPESYKSRSIYVFGVARNTPCGVRVDNGRLKLVGTPHGDGTVTWLSGRIDGIGQYYYLPASHGDLLATRSSFDALLELVSTGATAGLERTPPQVREIASPKPITYDADPPQGAPTETAALALLGAAPQRRDAPSGRRQLEVRVIAQDLRFIDQAIMVGHHEQDPIVFAERIIDTELLDGDLGQRQRLGLYAGPVGTATVVLRAPNTAERQRGSLRGAVVTGLGPLDGSLDQARLTEAARTGALRFLLHVSDSLADVLAQDTGLKELRLATLLLGFNSSANLSVASSVEALVRGVMEANSRFGQTTGLDLRIAQLSIIELYLDTAITAVYALRDLQRGLAPAAALQGTELVCVGELKQGEGARPRLSDATHDTYWPRLYVTGIAGGGLPATDDVIDDLDDAATDDTAITRVATRLHYVYVGRRARAETETLQRQPGLVEKLVAAQIATPSWDENFGRTLFQLMVPHDFKAQIRQLRQAVFVVDRTTANLPWELMLADDFAGPDAVREPMAIHARFVRQFSTGDYRREVRQNTSRTALVIGEPSTAGFGVAFPKPDGTPRDDAAALPGARAEAEAVALSLRAARYDVSALTSGEDATTILSALYAKPWRILHIAAHGVFTLPHADGLPRTGVLLSDGLLITAAEFAAMERVPEVVVLNCCHLGTVDLGSRNKLAASVATQLIGNGVRCVLVAGWAVSDKQARRFGETFYDALLIGNQNFGDAVAEARKAVWRDDARDITWGAFQAYGEPDWVADPSTSEATDRNKNRFASPEELLDALASLRVRATKRPSHGTVDLAAQLAALLDDRCTPAWRQLPEIHSSIGSTWYVLNEFGKAREELLAAVRAEDRAGRVPLRDIERLANAEARYGEDTGDLLMIQSAIMRLQGVDRMMSPLLGQPTEDARQNAERVALMGSAHKRMASVAARFIVKARLLEATPESRELCARMVEVMQEALANSEAAYRAAGIARADGRLDPYRALNALALSALAATDVEAPAETIALAKACGRQAALDNVESPDFWNVVMVPEALLVEHLLDRSLFSGGAKGDSALAEIRQAYAAALRSVLVKPVELDSVANQMELMATFLLAQADPTTAESGEARAAGRLLELRQTLQSSTPARAWLIELGLGPPAAAARKG